ncbi:MAG: TrmH family RNA methyltransferase [Minisyncoccia bacterium]
MTNRTSILVLENIRSVENTASIFRTADRFGVSKIVLVGTTPAPLDRFRRARQDFAKVSLGAEKRVPWEYEKTAESAVKKLKQDGFQIIALEQDLRAGQLKNFKAKEKFALIVGSEVAGVEKKTLELSDEIVEIGTPGNSLSLNVSVAAGVALFVLK